LNFRFHVTRHQALRLAERNLSLENLKNVVHYADSVKPLSRGHHGGQLKKFYKSADNRTLVVVAKIKGADYWLATGYYED